LLRIALSFGVDVLGALSEKLRSQNNDTSNFYRDFLESNEQYKKEKLIEKEYISKFLKYLISFSASNFLMIRVLLELKTSIQKGTSMKDSTGGEMLPGSASGATSSSGFGIGGFIDTGGNVGKNNTGRENEYEEDKYTLPKPQRGGDGLYTRSTSLVTNTPNYKICNVCNSQILINAKFCSKCGHRQQ
jgi:ribosomal protein L40E